MSERENDGQERTESPTPRKRERAREEGKVARSTELPAALGLLAGAVILSAAGGRALAGFSTQMLNES
jgi:flagellar biosynthetic protein FlhB